MIEFTEIILYESKYVVKLHDFLKDTISREDLRKIKKAFKPLLKSFIIHLDNCSKTEVEESEREWSVTLLPKNTKFRHLTETRYFYKKDIINNPEKIIKEVFWSWFKDWAFGLCCSCLEEKINFLDPEMSLLSNLTLLKIFLPKCPKTCIWRKILQI